MHTGSGLSAELVGQRTSGPAGARTRVGVCVPGVGRRTDAALLRSRGFVLGALALEGRRAGIGRVG